LNPEYIKIAEKRLGKIPVPLTNFQEQSERN